MDHHRTKHHRQHKNGFHRYTKIAGLEMATRQHNKPSIWNASATLPATLQVRCSKEAQSFERQAHPGQEAARMAAMKRLRHRLVTLCSQYGSNIKPPTLAMERWLSRAALDSAQEEVHEESSISDPVIPSKDTVDPGLVNDLSRNMGGDEAQSVAESLTADAKAAAERVAKALDDKPPSPENHWADAKKQLKDATKAVKKSSKAVQKAMDSHISSGGADEDDESETNEAESESLQKSLATLQDATTALEACRQKIQRIQNVQSDGNTVILDTSRRPGVCDVMLLQANGTPKKPYLTISMNHLVKFVQLWQLQQRTSKRLEPKHIYKNASKAIQSMSNAKDFLDHLYCCLARYETIKGAGYQCAMPPVAFDAAHKDLGLGVMVECFASPFNCRYRQYCSAFPDIERPFGSLGSFFDDEAFFPIQGSFEANPPFVPEIMWAMNDKLQRILENSEAQALSFLVIVPVWGSMGIGYVEALEGSDYVVAKSRVLAADHSFCDGAQHKAPRADLRPSSWDTAVVLLQNDAGAQEWPVSQDQLEDVFCTALKASKGKLSLNDWEQRGVARGGRSKTPIEVRHKRPAASQSISDTTTSKSKHFRFS